MHLTESRNGEVSQNLKITIIQSMHFNAEVNNKMNLSVKRNRRVVLMC